MYQATTELLSHISRIHWKLKQKKACVCVNTYKGRWLIERGEAMEMKPNILEFEVTNQF